MEEEFLEILPCPFCGSECDIIRTDFDVGGCNQKRIVY